jgi:hypothetical protein
MLKLSRGSEVRREIAEERRRPVAVRIVRRICAAAIEEILTTEQREERAAHRQMTLRGAGGDVSVPVVGAQVGGTLLVIRLNVVARLIVTEVIHDNIEDDLDVALVRLRDQRSEVAIASESGIDRRGVDGAVSVIGAVVREDRGDPERRRAEVAHIVQARRDARKIAAVASARDVSGLVGRQRRGIVTEVAVVEAIDLDGIDDFLAPERWAAETCETAGSVVRLGVSDPRARPRFRHRHPTTLMSGAGESAVTAVASTSVASPSDAGASGVVSASAPPSSAPSVDALTVPASRGGVPSVALSDVALSEPASTGDPSDVAQPESATTLKVTAATNVLLQTCTLPA